MGARHKNVYKFPIKQSKVYYWFNQYRAQKVKHGDMVANNWLVRLVPSQFHKQIHTMYYNWLINRSKNGK